MELTEHASIAEARMITELTIVIAEPKWAGLASIR
jgi:hypothetical protein